MADKAANEQVNDQQSHHNYYLSKKKLDTEEGGHVLPYIEKSVTP